MTLRKLEKILIKLYRQNVSLLFNQKHTHTHTHTHIYIYKWVWLKTTEHCLLFLIVIFQVLFFLVSVSSHIFSPSAFDHTFGHHHGSCCESWQFEFYCFDYLSVFCFEVGSFLEFRFKLSFVSTGKRLILVIKDIRYVGACVNCYYIYAFFKNLCI